MSTAPEFSDAPTKAGQDDSHSYVTPELPPPPPAPQANGTMDAAPKRPTTRAGRQAAAKAKALEKKAAADKRPTTATAKATPRRKPLETRLAANLAGLGTIVAAAGGMLSPTFVADGILIVEQSADLAKALAKVADDQPHVAAALERMLTAGVYSGLAAAMLPLVIGIAANHGALPQSVVEMLAAYATAPPDDE